MNSLILSYYTIENRILPKNSDRAPLIESYESTRTQALLFNLNDLIMRGNLFYPDLSLSVKKWLKPIS